MFIFGSNWLCNRKAELKVYTDFGNILHLCKRCYEIYDAEGRERYQVRNEDSRRMLTTLYQRPLSQRLKAQLGL
jgi:hypothetical protein